MKILVLSDSHGDVFSCKMAIDKHKDVSVVIHLGDGEEDLQELKNELKNKKVYKVAGNSYYSNLYGCPTSLNIKIGDVKIFMCHGHEYGVKNGLDRFLNATKNARAKIGLYGHTHIQDSRLLDDINILNPGSIKRGEYAIIIIDNKKISLKLKSL